jgi:hypothetical protein
MFQDRTGIKIPNLVIIIGAESGGCQVFQAKTVDHVSDLVEAIAIWRADQSP